jgi:hypothetical protein
MSRGDAVEWSWAVEHLEAARHYWVATIRKDGYPQARPVDGVWLDGVLGLSIGHGGIQRALQRPDGRFDATVHTESADDVVILEGVIERVAGRPQADRLAVADPVTDFDAKHAAALYKAKYDEDIPDVVNFVIRPRVAYGWRGSNTRSATKWTFD